MTASLGTVLVTPRSFGRDDPGLCRELERSASVVWERGTHGPDRLAALVSDVDGWIAGVEPIGESILERAPRLKVIARYGVGVDNVDVASAARRGIAVTNTPGANAGAVAELVVGLLVALARAIPAADRAARAGDWAFPGGVSLEGKVLGLLGFGAVGRAVARRVAGFGMEVIAHDPLLAAGAGPDGVRACSRAELVARSDFLSLHLPLTADTAGMVDAEFLAAMKPGARLVNTARGELVDEAALAAALADGRLAGAALDALADEPPAPGFALGTRADVILTPHIGAHTDHARHEMARRAIDNCLAVLRGDSPPDPVSAAAEVKL